MENSDFSSVLDVRSVLHRENTQGNMISLQGLSSAFQELLKKTELSSSGNLNALNDGSRMKKIIETSNSYLDGNKGGDNLDAVGQGYHYSSEVKPESERSKEVGKISADKFASRPIDEGAFQADKKGGDEYVSTLEHGAVLSRPSDEGQGRNSSDIQNNTPLNAEKFSSAEGRGGEAGINGFSHANSDNLRINSLVTPTPPVVSKAWALGNSLSDLHEIGENQSWAVLNGVGVQNNISGEIRNSSTTQLSVHSGSSQVWQSLPSSLTKGNVKSNSNHQNPLGGVDVETASKKANTLNQTQTIKQSPQGPSLSLGQFQGGGLGNDVKVEVVDQAKVLNSRPSMNLAFGNVPGSILQSGQTTVAQKNTNSFHSNQNGSLVINPIQGQLAQAQNVQQHTASQTNLSQSGVQTSASGKAAITSHQSSQGLNGPLSGGGEISTSSPENTTQENRLRQVKQKNHNQGFQEKMNNQSLMANRSVAEQISVKILKAIQAGKDQIKIQLKPAELGRVDIKMELTQDGRVMAVINADSKETLELLRRDASELQRALNDTGMQLNTGDLSFNLRGETEHMRDDYDTGEVMTDEGEDEPNLGLIDLDATGIVQLDSSGKNVRVDITA